jgi:glycosyltransferase involved in cell wall biosynthesis
VAEPRNGHLLSLVVPVYNEADNILLLLEEVSSTVKSRHETLLVYDFDEDSTLPPARRFAEGYPALRLVKNTVGRGVLNALKAGIAEAKGDVVVVTMADLSDDVSQIDDLVERIRGGLDLVAASRYMKGGQQIGGPPVKTSLSRLAGLSLRWLTRIGTHDATNNYKAYSRELVDDVEIESASGFELGLEMATKAHLGGYAIGEIPTTWRDRTAGQSRFQVLKWMPSYLRWYLRCIAGTWTGRARRAKRERAAGAKSSRPRPADVSRG